MKKKLLDKKSIDKTIIRLANEIIEDNKDLDKLVIIGIRTRGEIIAQRIINTIYKKIKFNPKYGVLDVTFHRDDFLTNLGSPEIVREEAANIQNL